MQHWGHPLQDKVTLFLGDGVLVAVAAVAGWFVSEAQLSHGSHRVLALLVILPAFLGSMYLCNLYNLAGINGLGTFVKVIVSGVMASAFCDAFFVVFRWKNATYYWSLGACAVVVPAATYVWRRIYFQNARRMRTPQNLVVVGREKDAQILNAAMDPIHARYSVLGFLRAETKRHEAEPAAVPATMASDQLAPAGVGAAKGAYGVGTAVAMAHEAVPAAETTTASEKRKTIPDLGPATSESLLRVVATCDVKAVVVHNEAMTFELAGALTRLRFNGIEVYSLLDFCMRASEEIPLEILNESWLSLADGFDLLQARFFRRVKRLTDVVLASVGLLLALPFMLLAAVAIRLDSPGPVLFRQRRVGWMGRPFELLKFRSMEVEAEKDGKPQWAALNDPRVTAVGRVLRKIHFDELPQVINILRGEMSFIGPRPERPEFVGMLNESINFYHLRQYLLPGITGWAQVNYPYGASLKDARRKLQYDLYYVCNASPLLDLRTLLRTARVVLFRQGSR
jgi:exopolysaccharide biosynthesis polyprenyl glycosylphosphotransferase